MPRILIFDGREAPFRVSSDSLVHTRQQADSWPHDGSMGIWGSCHGALIALPPLAPAPTRSRRPWQFACSGAGGFAIEASTVIAPQDGALDPLGKRHYVMARDAKMHADARQPTAEHVISRSDDVVFLGIAAPGAGQRSWVCE